METKNIETIDDELSFYLKGEKKIDYTMLILVPSNIDVQELFMKSTQAEKNEMKATVQEMTKNLGFPVFDTKGNMVGIATLEYSVLNFVGQEFDPADFGPEGNWPVYAANGAGTRRASFQASAKPEL